MSILSRILPFLYLGIVIVVLIFGIILFSYLLILGAMVGLILFLIAYIREKFFSSPNYPEKIARKRKGQTIDHDQQ